MSVLKPWKREKLRYLIQLNSGEFITADQLLETHKYKVFGGNGVTGYTTTYNIEEEVLVIGRVGAYCGNVYHVNSKSWITDNALICRTALNYRFMYYALNMLNLNSLANKSAQPVITGTKVKNQYLTYPLIDEQKLIARFLDKSTSKIEDAIKTKQAQLKTLETLKKSIIHKAVTKGLDDSVAMKDSGIEWIGEIPEHWKSQMLKRTTSIKARIGWQGLTSDEYRTEGNHLLVTGTDFKGRYINWETCHYVDEERYDEDTKIQLIDKDVLVTKDGTIGKISMAKDMPFPTTLNSGVFVTRPIKNEYIQEYMYWILASGMLSEFIEYSKVGSTIAHLYQKTFERFVYPLAPTEEQQPIVDFLDKEVEKIDTLTSNVKNQINKLTEYKKSLIYEYVTGKKQVKE